MKMALWSLGVPHCTSEGRNGTSTKMGLHRKEPLWKILVFFNLGRILTIVSIHIVGHYNFIGANGISLLKVSK